MAFEDFLKTLQEKRIHYYTSKEIKRQKVSIDPYIQSASWTAGGMTGASCWGGSVNRSVETSPESKFTELDELLFAINKKITLKHFRKIEENCVKIQEDSHTDYYGNYDITRSKVADLKSVYETLVSLGYNL